MAMIVYGGASAGVLLQVEPILDEVLPARENLGRTLAAILGSYFLKGLGAYISGYLMTDVGQRVVRELRTALFRHILGQPAALFADNTSGRRMSSTTNDRRQ